MLVSVLACMAALLGAATLAIVLLYRGWKTNRARIQDLQAQVAAQQIAALSGGAAPSAPIRDAEPEPVRRRRHLALYLGGGVVTVYASCRDSIKQLARTRPVAATAAVATVATVSTAAALVLVSSGDGGGGEEPGGPPTAVTDHPSPGQSTPGPGASESEGTTGIGPRGGEVWAGGPRGLVPADKGRRPADADSPTRGATPSPAGKSPGAVRPDKTGPAAVPEPPTASRPPDTRPQPSTPPPGAGDPEPTPKPTAPKPTPKPEPEPEPEEDGHGLCVKVPPLLDLCLLAGL
ncbi:hypothetical protein RMO59_00930 [Streptomyces alfalfae]